MADRKGNVGASGRAEVAKCPNGTAEVNTKGIEAIDLFNTGFVGLLIQKQWSGNSSTGLHIIKLKQGIHVLTLRENNSVILMMNFNTKKHIQGAKVFHIEFSLNLGFKQQHIAAKRGNIVNVDK